MTLQILDTLPLFNLNPFTKGTVVNCYIFFAAKDKIPWQFFLSEPFDIQAINIAGIPHSASFTSYHQLRQFLLNAKTKLIPSFSQDIKQPIQDEILAILDGAPES